MSQNKPLIVISNDDGIAAPGIRVLARVAAQFGDVVVAAPDKGYSGQSHAITVCTPLKVVDYDMGIQGVKGYKISGSPVDCVKLCCHALVDRKPDLILSGINHGSNLSTSIHYSGTMGAAREGALLGIVGVGLSFDAESHDADMREAERVAMAVVPWALSLKHVPGVFYGVNIPDVDKVKGVVSARMAIGHWREDYHMTEDPWGARHYWLVGSFINADEGDENTDIYNIKQGYATVTPFKLDATAYDEMNNIKIDL